MYLQLCYLDTWNLTNMKTFGKAQTIWFVPNFFFNIGDAHWPINEALILQLYTISFVQPSDIYKTFYQNFANRGALPAVSLAIFITAAIFEGLLEYVNFAKNIYVEDIFKIKLEKFKDQENNRALRSQSKFEENLAKSCNALITRNRNRNKVIRPVRKELSKKTQRQQSSTQYHYREKSYYAYKK